MSFLQKAKSLIFEVPPEEHRVDENAAEADLNDLLSNLPSRSGAPTRTAEQIVEATEGPNLDEIKAPPAGSPPPTGPDGSIDLQALYQQAGLTPTPFSAEQMLEMLASLPAELPLETRRQTMKVALSSMGKSIGATPETIVADASRKLAALAAFSEGLARHTDQYVATAQDEIAALQSQIEEKRKAIEGTRQKLAHGTQVCNAESHRLDEVLEFFSLDVPPSKYATDEGAQPGSPTNRR